MPYHTDISWDYHDAIGVALYDEIFMVDSQLGEDGSCGLIELVFVLMLED